MPNLSFEVPGASENRWTDLSASLITTDPLPFSRLPGLQFGGIQREVVVATGTRKRVDRLDLLLTKDGSPVAAIEAKLLSHTVPEPREQRRQQLGLVRNARVEPRLERRRRCPRTLWGRGVPVVVNPEPAP